MPPKRSSYSKLVVGIDLGGTNMQIGVVNHQNKIIGHHWQKTQREHGRARVIKRIVDGVHAACADAGVSIKQVAAVGIAAPGAIDMPRGIVLEAPNLRWKNVPLRALLTKTLRCKVVVDNDVNAAVWAEFRLGAGRKRRGNKSNAQGGDMLGVWLGTGVGGGLVINGRLFYGEFHTAGEVGHTVLYPEGERGRRIVEDFCSRTGMSRTIHLGFKRFPDSMLNTAENKAGKVIGSKELAQVFGRGDKLAIEVVNDAARLLGIAIANWITVLALDGVVIGGGVTEVLGEPFLNRVRAVFKANVFPKRSGKSKLMMTRLNESAGLLGAALLAREAAGMGR